MPVSKLPALLKGDEDDRRDVAAKVKLVTAIRRQFADDIIALGIFGGNDLQTGVMARLAERDPSIAKDTKALKAFFDRPGVDARIPHPTKDRSQHEDWASDIAAAVAYQWADVGFLVGLAVGLQLGAHVFDGGVR